MLGNKLSLLKWKLPEDEGYKWKVTVHPTGTVEIKCQTEDRIDSGGVTFDDDCPMNIIEHMMTNLGFTRKTI